MADTYSPSGIFLGLDSDDFATLKAAALQRIANGDFVSMSGGGKSHASKWELPPQHILLEVQYAINAANRTPRVGRVVYDVRQQSLS
jgi:hypothetical protein